MGNGGVIGTIEETFRNEKGVLFEWKIPKFLALPVVVGKFYSSPEIRILNSVWKLWIYPNGIVGSPEWIRLELVRSDLGKPVRFTIGVKKADGDDEYVIQDQKYPDHESSYMVSKFLHRSELESRRSRLAPSDVLTISCIWWSDEPPPTISQNFFSCETQTKGRQDVAFKEKLPTHLHTKGMKHVSSETETDNLLDFTCRGRVSLLDTKGKRLVSRQTQTEIVSDTSYKYKERGHLDLEGDSTLRKHPKDLLLTGDDHDVIYCQKDIEYQKFTAHEIMLRARSPVFTTMLKHKMEKSTNDPILVEDCEPDTFSEFLNYICTGKVEDLSPRKAVGLYYAADKYDPTGLKQICIEYLKASLSPTLICDVIALATTHDENDLLKYAINYFTKHTKEILATTEWQRFVKNDFHTANEFYIKAFEMK